MKKRYVVYEYPVYTNDLSWYNGRTKITVEEAIMLQRKSGSAKGYEYETDEKALQDFTTIHGAWIIEE